MCWFYEHHARQAPRCEHAASRFLKTFLTTSLNQEPETGSISVLLYGCMATLGRLQTFEKHDHTIIIKDNSLSRSCRLFTNYNTSELTKIVTTMPLAITDRHYHGICPLRLSRLVVSVSGMRVIPPPAPIDSIRSSARQSQPNIRICWENKAVKEILNSKGGNLRQCSIFLLEAEYVGVVVVQRPDEAFENLEEY